MITRHGVLGLLVLLDTLLLARVNAECTTIIVSKEATVDGSVIATHANDAADLDYRMAFVPARKHAPGTQRPIIDLSGGQYPRIVGDRASIYQPADPSQKANVPLGYIAEVSETYALYEAGYSLMNEHGLGIGESTAGSPLDGRSLAKGGHALFCIAELIAVALERCKSAQCAIRTMGDLAERYGFFGEELYTGESLSVVDNQGEAWVFHVSAALNGTSAVWVAQRVPAGHAALTSNALIIGEVEPDSDDFIFSDKLFENMRKEGLWDGKGKLNIARTLSYDPPWYTVKGATPLYTTMRRMHILNKLAPSRRFPLSEDSADYPFSVAVEKKLSHNDVFELHRDHYEGTPYDMTKGLFAGPWSNPNRPDAWNTPYFDAPKDAKQGQGNRPMSMPRGSYVAVSHTHVPEPKVWFAADTAASSVFAPFFVRVLTEGITPLRFDVSYSIGNQMEFRFGESAWWAFDFVANWMNINFQNISQRYVYPMVREMQQKINDDVRAAEEATHRDGRSLEKVQIRLQADLVKRWWELASTLIVRYNDGYLNYEPGKSRVQVVPYPEWFLDQVGFNCENDVFPRWPKIDWGSENRLKEVEGWQSERDAHPNFAPWLECNAPQSTFEKEWRYRGASPWPRVGEEGPSLSALGVPLADAGFGYGALAASALCGVVGTLVALAGLRRFSGQQCDRGGGVADSGYRYLG